MKILNGPRVQQVRIFREDSIPYMDLCIQSNLDSFQEAFSFRDVSLPLSVRASNLPVILIFSDGSFKHEDSVYRFLSLQFESRKITVDINGGSEIADAAFKKIEKLLTDLDKNKAFSSTEFYVKTEETECSVELDIDINQFLSNGFIESLNQRISKVSKFHTRKTVLKRFSFQIFYENIKELENVQISLSPKTLTIEPRSMTVEEENIFFTKSPFDSKTHIKFLKQLESDYKTKM